MINALLFHEIKQTSNNHSDISIKNFEYTIKKLSERNALVNSIETINNQDYNNELLHVLTFDDGRLSDYRIAFPLLMKNSFCATFYIITELVGKKNYMNWDNILEMSNYGMEIGSHSCSHPNFTLLTSKQQFYELSDSKKILEDKLGKNISSFSVPNGAYNKSVVLTAFEVGYKNVSISKPGINKFPIINNSLIARNSFNRLMDKEKIDQMLFPSTIKVYTDSINYALREILKKSFGMKSYEKIRNKIFK